MKIAGFEVVLITLVVLFSFGSVCFAGDVKISPHSDDGDCTICHVASANKLRSWFTFGSTKREMKADLNELCLKCHTVEPTPEGSLGIGIGHATGKKLTLNRQNLPLASDGTITCATTCHNMHPTSDDGLLQRKRLRMSVTEMCMSCHKY